MSAYLEVWLPEGAQLVPLDVERLTIGRVDSNDVSLTSDDEVSRLHAVIERVGGGWCVRDLSSRNGTFVNGERVSGDRPLRPRDEIRIGQTRLVLRAPTDADADAARPTVGAQAAPT